MAMMVGRVVSRPGTAWQCLGPGQRGRWDAWATSQLPRRKRSVDRDGVAQDSDPIDFNFDQSPSFIQTGGVRRAPTPPGVPVTITSPASSGATVDT